MARRSEGAEAWRDDAECAIGGHDPEMWFETTRVSREAAKRVCRGCPVIAECAAWALSVPDQAGVAGGMTERERRAIRSRRRPAAGTTTTKKERAA